MVKKLISKSEFARLAGVSPAAVTKALRTILIDAADGKRIDANHPIAVKYVADKAAPTTPPPATGIDTLYEYAVEHCQKIKRISTTALQRELKIGYTRAKRITDTMKVNGVVIDMTTTPPPPPKQRETVDVDKIAHVVKGHDAKNNTKKSAALANLNNDIEHGTNIVEIPEDISAFVHMTLYEIFQRFGTETAFIDWLKATKEIENINEKRLKNAATRGELVNRDLIKLGVIEPFDTTFNKLLTDGARAMAVRVNAMSRAGRSVEECEKYIAGKISSFIKPAKAKIVRTLRNA